MALSNLVLFALINTIIVPFQNGHSLEVVPAGFLPTARGYGNAVYDGDDSVFVVGGEHAHNDFEEVRDILSYNLTTGVVTLVGALPKASKLGALTPAGNGSFIHFGGYGCDFEPLPEYCDGSIFQYRFTDISQFSIDNTAGFKIGDLPFARTYHAAIYDKSRFIYIIGGTAAQHPKDILKYEVATGEISVIGQTPQSNWSPAAALVGGTIYVFVDVIYRFDPSTGHLENTGVSFHDGYVVATAVGTDIYLIGGFDIDHFYKYNTINGTLEEVEVTNWPYESRVLTPGVAYVEKLNRIYIFGGGGSPFHDEIYYIQL